jgi:hypothetical protein
MPMSMFKVKAFCGGVAVIDWRMASVPNVGEEIRVGSKEPVYYKVMKVVVCLDEDPEGLRVNLELEKVA